MGNEAALLMASFPYGWPERSPIPPTGEVMTGFEYTAANGMLFEGMQEEGLKVIENIRDRYDGLKRNPFGEIECGRHYARAMTAYGAVLALTGFHYSGVEKKMKFKPIGGKYFWANGDTYGTLEQNVDKNTISVRLKVLGENSLELKEFELREFGVHSFDRVQHISDEIGFNVRLNKAYLN